MIWNTLQLMLSTATRILTSAVLFVLMARFWGPEQFGHFAYAFAIAALLAVVVDYGFTLQMVNDIGAGVMAPIAAVRRAGGVKILLALFTAAGALCWAAAAENALFGALLVPLVIAAALNSFGQFYSLPFRGISRFGRETRIVILANLVHFGLAGGGLALGAGPVAVAWLFVASRATYAAVGIAALSLHFQSSPRPTFSLGALGAVLRTGLPYAAFVGVGTAYFQIDTVLVKEFLGAEDVGLYQAGIRLLIAATIVPEVLTNVYLPAVASCRSNQNDVMRLGERLVRHLTVFGICGLATFAAAAKPMILLLFGADYVRAASLLPVFGVVLWIRFVAYGYGLLLTVRERQAVRTLVVAAALATSVGCNVLLIPRFGLGGAVVAAVITHLVLLGGYVVGCAREYGSVFLTRRGGALGVLGVLGAATTLLQMGIVGDVLVAAIAGTAVVVAVPAAEWKVLGSGRIAFMSRASASPFDPSRRTWTEDS